VGNASAAHADSGYGLCWQAGRNGLDPVAERCDQNVTTVSSWTYEYPNREGGYEVDLRYSGECETNWARVVTTTSRPFCITNCNGDVQRNTSEPGIASWTDMVNGAPNVRDEAYLSLPSPTDVLGENVLYASDQPANAPRGGESFSYPCWV
jgi:hypothetical protein